MYTKSIVI
jgi:hypothetical protein